MINVVLKVSVAEATILLLLAAPMLIVGGMIWYFVRQADEAKAPSGTTEKTTTGAVAPVLPRKKDQNHG